jgi:GST-like protein
MAIYPWLRPHKWQGQDIAAWPNLQRWYNAMRGRPAVQRGLAVMAGRHAKNREKPSGESWDVLFGQGQFEAR